MEIEEGDRMIKIPVGIPLKEAEKLIIIEALDRNNGNRTHTAIQLEIGTRTLQRKLKIYGIGPRYINKPLPATELVEQPSGI